MTVYAHFDGKVIVPDEPLDLPHNQALVVQIRPIDEQSQSENESVLTWLAAHAVDSKALPTDLADRHNHYLYGPHSPNEQRE
jgi:hypothetical protein